MSGKKEYTGKLQLIKLSDDDNEYRKYYTDIQMVLSEDHNIFFYFYFNLEANRSKKIIIDSSFGEKNGISAFNIEVMNLGKTGFILNFTVGGENIKDGTFYICSARFDTPLPQIGFIKQILYYFDFNALVL